MAVILEIFLSWWSDTTSLWLCAIPYNYYGDAEETCLDPFQLNPTGAKVRTAETASISSNRDFVTIIFITFRTFLSWGQSLCFLCVLLTSNYITFFIFLAYLNSDLKKKLFIMRKTFCFKITKFNGNVHLESSESEISLLSYVTLFTCGL